LKQYKTDRRILNRRSGWKYTGMLAGILVIMIAICGVFAACGAGESDTTGSAGKSDATGSAGESDVDSASASDAAGEEESSSEVSGNQSDSGDAGAKAASKANGTAAWLFDISTTDINGGAFDATALRENRLTVVNLWATWCPPCVEELPALAELQEAYSAEGVQIVGVLIDASEDGAIDAANTLLKDAKASFTSIIPETLLESNVIQDVEYVPTTLLVDADGNILDTIVGGNDYSSWSGIIEDTLAGLNDH